MGERRLIVGLCRIHRLCQMMDRWVEEVEYDPAVELEVVPDGAEAGELLLYPQQVLKGAEWQRDQPKPAAQIEVPYVSVLKVSTPPYIGGLRVEPRSATLSMAFEASRPLMLMPAQAVGMRTRPVPHPSSRTGPP
jgi:hypothetical protein